jgi:hypothetical protein
MELVMPPHIEIAPAFGMALYSAKAILGGRASDVLGARDGELVGVSSLSAMSPSHRNRSS